MTLSEKIVYCRKRAGLSQEELAERVGVSRQAVSKWELGDAAPEVGKLLALAKVFGVTTDWLLSEEDPAPDESAPPPAAHTWVDAVPGAVGRLLRQYGWLFGLRMAISGGLFAAFGFLMRAVMRNPFGGSADRVILSDPYGDLGGVVWTDEAGNLLGRTGGMSVTNPASMISGFVIGLGLILLIAGIVIAVSLYPKRKSPKE